MFLYPDNRHLFAANSLPDYDEQAAALLLDPELSFLDRIAQPSGSRLDGRSKTP